MPKKSFLKSKVERSKTRVLAGSGLVPNAKGEWVKATRTADEMTVNGAKKRNPSRRTKNHKDTAERNRARLERLAKEAK